MKKKELQDEWKTVVITLTVVLVLVTLGTLFIFLDPTDPSVWKDGSAPLLIGISLVFGLGGGYYRYKNPRLWWLKQE